jgi:hypothetical protein
MSMLRRSLALMVVVTLVLAWTGPAAFAGAVKACADVAAAPAATDGCKGCNDRGDRNQPNCQTPACAGVCAARTAVAVVEYVAFARPRSADSTNAVIPADNALARPIRPDLPPPR